MTKQNLKTHLIKQTFWAYLLSYIAAPFGLFIKILYSKNLSLEDFGLFYMVLGFYSLISIFNDLGFTETLSYYGVKFYEKKDYKSLKLSYYYAILMQLGTGIIISSLIFIFSEFLSIWWFNTPNAAGLLRLMTIYFICVNTIKPMYSIFLVKLDMFWNKLFTSLYLIGVFIISFILFKLNIFNNSISAGISWSGTFLILVIFYFFIVRWKFKKEFSSEKLHFDFKLYKKLWSYALPVVIGSGATLILGRIDTQMIGIMTNVSNVGFYEIALSTASILSILIMPAVGFLFPLTTKLITEKKKKELENILSLFYRVFLFILIPLFIIFTQYGKLIISILFDSNKFHSYNLFIPLLISALFAIYYGLNFQILAGLGKVKQRNKILYLAGFSNIILNYIFIKLFGFVGVAYSTTIVSFILFISSYIIIYKDNIKIKINKFFLILLNGIIFYLLVDFLKKVIKLNNFYIEGIIVLCISGISYLIIGWLFKIYRISEIMRMGGIENK